MMKLAFRYALVLTFVSILIACGGGGGGGGGSTAMPGLPKDATTITAANTSTIARSAIDNVQLDDVFTSFRQEVEKSSAGKVIQLVVDQAFDHYLPSRSIALRTETQPCGNSQGSITVNANEAPTSATGSIIFNACNVSGVVVNGSLSVSASFSDSTGAYSISANGSLTFSDGLDNAAIGMNFSETGNDISGSYSSTISLSVSDVPGANFLLTTTQPITGVFSDVYSGEILVEGAAGTRLRITVITTNLADVYLDDGSGTFVYHSTINV